MSALSALIDLVNGVADEFRDTRLQDLRFWHHDDSRLMLIALIFLVLAMVVLRSTLARRGVRQRVSLPALLSSIRTPPWAAIRHTPIVLVAVGLPFLALAVADPYTSLTQKQEKFPGRRICIMLDASSSMVRPFNAPTLRSGATSQATFFTTVAAAQRFIQLRTQGKYRDLMALVEFGDQAYMVTPFTTDYDNIVLSLSLVGDFTEFVRFPDQGTILSNAVEQGVALFRAFDFLDASGNLMVLFSDGEDSEVIAGGKTVGEIVRDAVAAKVPVFFVRTRFERGYGTVVSDAQWKDAVERTGGRFYAASNEASLLQAIRDIDRASAGKIDITQYVSQRPRYRPFALAAAGLWSLAIALAVTVPALQELSMTRSLIALATVMLVLLAGETLRRAALLEERLAQADEELTTTTHVTPETAASLEESVDVLSRVPALGAHAAEEVRRQQAEAAYWQGDYASLVGSAASSAQTAAADAPLMLLSANAAFRSAVAQNPLRQALARSLDDVIKAYGEVLKVDSESSDASFNYEYVVRLRTALVAGRGASVPVPHSTNMQGEPGEQPVGPGQRDFNVIVPLRREERQEQMDSGAGADFKRQG